MQVLSQQGWLETKTLLRSGFFQASFSALAGAMSLKKTLKGTL
jgi:hypothetical protein